MIGMLCTAFWDPFDVAHILNHFLWFWTKWVIGLFCRRSCWRACRSGWFSIFWINSRTLVLCSCFTTECGNPGIRKSMFTSFSIVFMTWIVMINNGSLRSFTKCCLQRWNFRFHDMNVFENYLAHFLCLFQQRVSPFSLKKQFLREKNQHWSPENGTFFFLLAQFSRHPW